ncbi:hypothetical protein MJ1_0530 [Nanobdella aerobiophila]|uniref:rRNA small subunit methyltransferase F RNA-binding PUA-like domain-containing protein n=1 Tax=Nanobdella aerobiophila TaxID=2586965 RepID=A0A915SKJ3_9ARCH|nr:hypothetical protein [Nanobdella aerobiophila]BBL45683.1 hypothetical protein MJ1_0530 [Nanobdella aerobiophila]
MKEVSKKYMEEIIRKIENFYGVNIDKSFIKNSRFFMTKDKIYMFNKNYPDFLDQKYLSRYGLYIIKIEKNNIRFSIEGAQLFGIDSKRLINVDKNMIFKKEYDIKIDKEDGFYIAKDGNDILCSIYIKDRELRDFIPKERKISL